ncbi:tyrosine-type recombinase/integrase [Lysinibacillus sp. NPDC093688]|uniref:tyrosine-type recombinase/integrase n=1 Tax=Lysinibacillus sp. NPDC093688 TaxID=3390577 RepID=UPI003D036BD0
MKIIDEYWKSTDICISSKTKTILNEYLLCLKLENKAVATITKYKWILERFLRECKVPLMDMTSEDVREWINEFSVDKKPNTIALVLATLSSFFQFCFDEEYIERMIIKKRWRPQLPKSLPNYLDEYEFSRIKLISEQLPIRDRAIILFLLTSGCRVSEMSALNIEDINMDKRTAKVIGKGNKIRTIHFSIECALALQDYLHARSYNPKEPLFMNKFGERLLSGGIRGVLKKVGKQADLKKNFHPHCCRHTFATNLLARGADLQFIADEMGHADLNTTRIYAQIPSEDKRLKYQNIMG